MRLKPNLRSRGAVVLGRATGTADTDNTAETGRGELHAACNSCRMHDDGRERPADRAETDVAGDTELFQVATRVLTGIALRALTLTARPMPLRQFQLLAVLDEMGRSSAAQVAAALRLTVPSATRLADRLVASGHLVHRTHLYNRSVATFELTQAGRDLVSRVMHWRHQELDRILRRLPPAQRLATVDALRAFLQAAAGSGYGTDHLTVDVSTDPVTAT